MRETVSANRLSVYSQGVISLENLQDSILAGRIYIMKKIKIGKYGAFYKAQDIKSAEKTLVMVKIINLAKMKKQLNDYENKIKIIQKQVCIMKRVEHSRIAPLLGYYKSSTHLMIVTKYYQHGCLNGKISQQKAINIVKQIGSAIIAMHQKNFGHKMLSPYCVYEHKGSCYLADFGVSSIVFDCPQTQPLINQFNEDFQLNVAINRFQVDFYAIGALLYVMISPQKQFKRKLQKLKTYGDGKQLGNCASAQTKVFLRSCLKNWKAMKVKQYLKNQVFSQQFSHRHRGQHFTSFQNPENQQQMVNSCAHINYNAIMKQEYKQIEQSQELNLSMAQIRITQNSQQEQEYSNQQNQKLNKLKYMNLQINKLEYIYEEIVQKIEKIKPFKLQCTNGAEIMYMLSSRLFLQIISLNNEVKHYSNLQYLKKDFDYRLYCESISTLSTKYQQKFEDYGKTLKQYEDRFKNKVGDFFRNIFIHQQFKKKNLLFNGLECEYKKKDHIQWIQNALNSSIQLKNASEQLKKLHLICKNYTKILNLNAKQLNNAVFKQYVQEQLIKQ